ncbi:hypothetical protein MRX96_002962 [Rhipicephalus microplus]
MAELSELQRRLLERSRLLGLEPYADAPVWVRDRPSSAHADVFDDSDIANSNLGVFSSEPADVDHIPIFAGRLWDRLAQSVPL